MSGGRSSRQLKLLVSVFGCWLHYEPMGAQLGSCGQNAGKQPDIVDFMSVGAFVVDVVSPFFIVVTAGGTLHVWLLCAIVRKLIV